MAIGTQSDLTMHSGDTRLIQITIVDSGGSSPINVSTLTGAQVTWALSKKSKDTTAPRGSSLVTKTLGSGISFTNTGSDGKIDVLLSPADTAALSGDYYHELQLTISDAIYTVLYGKVTIAKDLI